MSDFMDGIMNLPEDWWRHPYTAIDFANLYQRHSLGLLLAIEAQGRYKHEMLSGVSFYHHDHVLWLTAGHVIEYLERVLQEYGDHITMMAWCDQSGSSDANYFPVSHRNFRRFYIYENGIDIGFGILQGLDAKNIVETPGGPFLTAPSIETYARIVPEGFHLVGYPGES